MNLSQKISNFMKTDYHSLNCGFMINSSIFETHPNIALDGTVITKTGTTATSDSTSITVGSNVNRILIIVADEYNSGAGFTTVTVGGNNATLAKSYHLGGNGGGYAEIWYYINPPVGSNTVAITKTSGTSYGFGIYSLYNVKQTSPIGVTAQLGNASSGTPQPNGTITPTTTGSWILDSLQVVSGGTSPTASLTSGFGVSSSANIYEASQYSSSPTINSSNSMSWSNLSGGYWWDWVAVEILRA